MGELICPLFYMVMLHRRGRVDDIIISDSCGCLGEKCQWYNGICKNFYVAEVQLPNDAIKEPKKNIDEMKETTDASGIKTPLFAEDKSEFSEL